MQQVSRYSIIYSCTEKMWRPVSLAFDQSLWTDSSSDRDLILLGVFNIAGRPSGYGCQGHVECQGALAFQSHFSRTLIIMSPSLQHVSSFVSVLFNDQSMVMLTYTPRQTTSVSERYGPRNILWHNAEPVNIVPEKFCPCFP